MICPGLFFFIIVGVIVTSLAPSDNSLSYKLPRTSPLKVSIFVSNMVTVSFLVTLLACTNLSALRTSRSFFPAPYPIVFLVT